MNPNARTPEELETLLEDTLLLQDLGALAELFEEWAVLAVDDGSQQLRGGEQITSFAAGNWVEGLAYVAEPRLILQARDTALVLTARGVNVVRRGFDGGWRYAILHLRVEKEREGRDE